MKDELIYFFVAFTLFMLSLAYVFWKRRTISVRHGQEGVLVQSRRCEAWAGSPFFKVMVCVGLSCAAISSCLQVREMRRKNTLSHGCHGVVASYVSKAQLTDFGWRFSGGIYNGLNSSVYIGDIKNEFHLAAAGKEFILLNELSDLSAKNRLAPGQELFVEFVLPFKDLRDFECKYVFTCRNELSTSYITNRFVQVKNGEVLDKGIGGNRSDVVDLERFRE